MYHFLSGYTAKMPAPERTRQRTRSDLLECVGAPFMVLHPGSTRTSSASAWKNISHCGLVSITGWSGGSYGEGQRMKIANTRAMIRAILNGALSQVETRPPDLGVGVPVSCPGVPAKSSHHATPGKIRMVYRKARDLARSFNEIKKYAAGCFRRRARRRAGRRLEIEDQCGRLGFSGGRRRAGAAFQVSS